jgi:hypothetical protein
MARKGARNATRRGPPADVAPGERPVVREPHHEEEEPRAEQRVDQRHPARERRGVEARQLHLRQRRRADGAEGHARRVAEKRQHHRADGIVAQPHEQRRGQRHRRAEARRTLDEEAEEPGDQDRLRAPVRRQPAEASRMRPMAPVRFWNS